MKMRAVAVVLLVMALVMISASLWVPLLTASRTPPPETGPPTPGVAAGMPGVVVPSAHPTWPGYTSPDRQTGVASPDRRTGVASSAPRENLTEPPPGAGLRRYLDQQVAWQRCGKHECATVAAPLDWDDPDGEAITLSMLRVRSAAPTRGPLFVNPGGPGIGGKRFAASIPADAFQGYDIIGWDPRGTGESTPVRCATKEQTEAHNQLDGSPDDESEYRELLEASREFARLCRENSGRLLDHVSTLDTARDLDLLRALLGADKLAYFGISYGTHLGAVYAEFFPDRVGRMILDSAVDITGDRTDTFAEGFEVAFDAFLGWCVRLATCPFGETIDQARSTIAAFVDGLDAAPQQVGNRTLTQTLAVVGIQSFLYGDEESYPQLIKALQSAMAGNGASLLKSSNWLTGRNDDGSYDTVAYANPAIRCLDWADAGLKRAREQWVQVQRSAPLFGRWLGPGTGCEVWTAAPVPQYRLVGAGAPPIMVVGVRTDPATPYRQAVAMAGQLESGFLVTLEGSGHGAVLSGNQCILRVARDYLLHGKWGENTVCR